MSSSATSHVAAFYDGRPAEAQVRTLMEPTSRLEQSSKLAMLPDDVLAYLNVLVLVCQCSAERGEFGAEAINGFNVA